MSCSENRPNDRSDDRSGEERKLRAHKMLEAHREAYIRLARRKLLEVLIFSGTATIDDVRDLVELPDGMNPKLFGAVPSVLAIDHIIDAVGYVKTSRPIAHARPITLWRLKDIGKAHEWLRNHPALPIEDPNENGEPAE